MPTPLSAAQDEVVSFTGRAARLIGPARSGKTEVVVARAARLAHGGEQVLVVAAPAARSAVSDRILRADPTASPRVRVTSWHGLCRAVVEAHDPAQTVIGTRRKRELVAALLDRAADSLAVERAVPALDALRRSWLGREEILTHAEASGADIHAWEGLATLVERYEALLRDEGLVDATGMLLRATVLLRDPAVRRGLGAAHLLVDDHESASFAEHRLLVTIAGPTQIGPDEIRSVVVAGDPSGPTWGGPPDARWLVAASRQLGATLDVSLGACEAPPARFEAVRAHHRSVVGDAVIGEVQHLLATGMRADEIAVVVPAGADWLRTSIAAAGRRHHVQLGTPRQRCGDDPVVDAIAAAVHATVQGLHEAAWPERAARLGLDHAWAQRQRTGGAPADLAFVAWSLLAPRLLGLDGAEPAATPVAVRTHPSIAAIRTFVAALDAARGAAPSAALAVAADALVAPDRGGVTVLDDAATRGQGWRAVVLTGCEEGVRPPRPAGSLPAIDLELLDGPDVPSMTERHARTLAEARRRFEHLRQRAAEVVVAVAAPEPGVLISRFVEATGMAPRAPRLPMREPRAVSAPPPSTGNRPYWPGQIRASASSLETFANCPLQYTLGYVLGIDTPAGVQAAVGTLVHNVLERFLDPVNPVERTRERLTEILDDEWDDALFTYRAQASEYRTRVEDMLETWFEHEGRHADSVAKVEHHFRIDVAGHVLSGYIDRIDRSVPPGRTEADAELEVIDYKTGSWKNARAGEESLQLGTYHLAASRDPELVALGRPTKLRLHFLQVGKNAWQTVGPNHAAVWEALITNLLRDIETGRDEPSPEADCEYCDFHRVCPIQPQGRLVPIRPSTAVKNSARP